jgi:hypothetical protein
MYHLQGEQYASFLKTNCHVKLLSQLCCKHRYGVKGTTVLILKTFVGATIKALKICTVAPPPMPLKTLVCGFGICLCFTFVGMTYSCSMYMFAKYHPGSVIPLVCLYMYHSLVCLVSSKSSNTRFLPTDHSSNSWLSGYLFSSYM